MTSRDQSICEMDVTKLQSLLGLIFDLFFFFFWKYLDQELNPVALPMITSTDIVFNRVKGKRHCLAWRKRVESCFTIWPIHSYSRENLDIIKSKRKKGRFELFSYVFKIFSKEPNDPGKSLKNSSKSVLRWLNLTQFRCLTPTAHSACCKGVRVFVGN